MSLYRFTILGCGSSGGSAMAAAGLGLKLLNEAHASTSVPSTEK